MSKLKKIVIYLFFLCLGMHSAFSETPEQITFSYISINEGLSQSTVFSIDQDKRGNMWFATYDGVNKYDGYAFTVYQHNEDDPNSIRDGYGLVRVMVCPVMMRKKTYSRTSSMKRMGNICKLTVSKRFHRNSYLSVLRKG